MNKNNWLEMSHQAVCAGDASLMLVFLMHADTLARHDFSMGVTQRVRVCDWTLSVCVCV